MTVSAEASPSSLELIVSQQIEQQKVRSQISFAYGLLSARDDIAGLTTISHKFRLFLTEKVLFLT